MIEINLLPVREQRRKANLQQQALLLGATLVGAALLAGAYHSYLSSMVSSAQEQAMHLQRQIDAFGTQLEQVETFRTTKGEMEEKLSVIDTLDRSRSGPVLVLDELATHTPERLWLTRLESSNSGVVLEGVSLDNELVALFLTALSESPHFANVELEETQLLERDGLKLNEFRVRANLTTPGASLDAVRSSVPPSGVAGR